MSVGGRHAEKLKKSKEAERENRQNRAISNRKETVWLSMVVYHASGFSSRENSMLLPPNFVGHPMQISSNGCRLIRIVFKAPSFFLICRISRSGCSTSSMASTLGVGG